jgi:hypothetical protein
LREKEYNPWISETENLHWTRYSLFEDFPDSDTALP